MAKRRIYYEESSAAKIYSVLRFISPYFLLSFIGLLAWGLSYLILVAYKEIIITYLKRDEKFDGKEYYFKFIEYKKHFKNLYVFNFAILLLWFAIYLIENEWRSYCLITGFYIFVIGYIICWSVYYKFYSYKNDYFDDMKFLVKYIKENYFNKSKIKKEKIE